VQTEGSGLELLHAHPETATGHTSFALDRRQRDVLLGCRYRVLQPRMVDVAILPPVGDSPTARRRPDRPGHFRPSSRPGDFPPQPPRGARSGRMREGRRNRICTRAGLRSIVSGVRPILTGRSRAVCRAGLCRECCRRCPSGGRSRSPLGCQRTSGPGVIGLLSEGSPSTLDAAVLTTPHAGQSDP
jgi:hypothetical protein